MRERRDRVQREAEHPRERVLGLAGVARVAVVGHGRLRVADPHRHPAQEAVALAHRQQGVERAAVQQAEVAGVVLELDLGELVEQPVEPARGAQLEARLAVALLADGVDDVAPGPPVVEHRRDHLGRVLEIGVEHHDGVAAGVVEAGGERRLVAEVPRQVDDAHPRVVRGQRLELHRGAVGGPVVDEDELEGQRVQGRAHARVELLDRGVLVVDGRHDADQRQLTRRPVERLSARRSSLHRTGSVPHLVTGTRAGCSRAG